MYFFFMRKLCAEESSLKEILTGELLASDQGSHFGQT